MRLSKRDRTDRACKLTNGDDKRTFMSKGEAEYARRHQNGSHLHVYRCPIHNGYHLGRRPERRQP